MYSSSPTTSSSSSPSTPYNYTSNISKLHTSPSSSTNTSSSTPSSSRNNHGKRKQVKNACVNCQRACKKCDDQRPCGRCVRYGIEDGCINSQRKERKRKGHDEDELESYEQESFLTPHSHSRSHSHVSKSSPLSSKTQNRAIPTTRVSSRNGGGIRSFSQELIKSLQSEENDEISEEEFEEKAREVIGNLVVSPVPTLTTTLHVPNPVVTEEFRTLAHLCFELYQIISARHPPPMIVNTPLPHPPQVIDLQTQKYNNQIYLNRSTSPPQSPHNFLTSQSPIYTHHIPVSNNHNISMNGNIYGYGYGAGAGMTKPSFKVNPSIIPSHPPPLLTQKEQEFHFHIKDDAIDRSQLNRTPPDEDIPDKQF